MKKMQRYHVVLLTVAILLGTAIGGLVDIISQLIEAEGGFQQVIIEGGVWIKQIVDAVEAG